MYDNKNFYPTPKKTVDKMLNKIGKKARYAIRYILEPSAGKGDIIDNYLEFYKIHNHIRKDINYKNISDYVKIDAIEINDDLSNMLKGKGVNVIYDDFLKFKPDRYYDLILMNPPFDNGVEHLLKAIRIQERIGGEIVCILNAESLKNTYSNNRKYLKDILEKYNADIEYIQNAFSDAERQTDVEIALIHIDIPMLDNMTMFEKEFKQEYPDIRYNSFQEITSRRNKLEALAFECELIKKSGEKLFQEKLKIKKLLKGMNLKLDLKITNNRTQRSNELSINDFVDDINKEYWEKFIDETDLLNRVPSKLKENFQYNIIENQKNISFNLENARYFYDQLIKAIPKTYEESVSDIFDLITKKYHYSDTAWNKNIHYYNGWKTNKSYKISKKAIIQTYGKSVIPSELHDLNIIFNNISGEKYSLGRNYDGEINKRIINSEKKIDTEHFLLDSYKKGTLHITFKNQEHLDQFNILASKGKKWLPSDFGNKSYSDMSTEEKQLLIGLQITPEQYQGYTSRKDYLRLTEAM